jgi:hypothetical protein
MQMRFIGDAAKRIAMMYSFLGSSSANEVNPYVWLKTTLENIPVTKMTELHTLLPGYKNEVPYKNCSGCQIEMYGVGRMVTPKLHISSSVEGVKENRRAVPFPAHRVF